MSLRSSCGVGARSGLANHCHSVPARSVLNQPSIGHCRLLLLNVLSMPVMTGTHGELKTSCLTQDTGFEPDMLRGMCVPLQTDVQNILFAMRILQREVTLTGDVRE